METAILIRVLPVAGEENNEGLKRPSYNVRPSTQAELAGGILEQSLEATVQRAVREKKFGNKLTAVVTEQEKPILPLCRQYPVSGAEITYFLNRYNFLAKKYWGT